MKVSIEPGSTQRLEWPRLLHRRQAPRQLPLEAAERALSIADQLAAEPVPQRRLQPPGAGTTPSDVLQPAFFATEQRCTVRAEIPHLRLFEEPREDRNTTGLAERLAWRMVAECGRVAALTRGCCYSLLPFRIVIPQFL